MRTTIQRLSARDRQAIGRIIQPAALAARLVNEYLQSDEFNALLRKLVREELARQHEEVCHGSH